jgi:cytoskeletal protein CcmA (bactofilin family)
MLFKRKSGTTIAEGLQVKGSLEADGLVTVNGHVQGNLHCGSLVVSRQASISGEIQANDVVVNGKVQGPIHGGTVVLKRHARVVGDIEHQSLAIEKGAHFDGRSVRQSSTAVGKAEAATPPGDARGGEPSPPGLATFPRRSSGMGLTESRPRAK